MIVADGRIVLQCPPTMFNFSLPNVRQASIRANIQSQWEPSFSLMLGRRFGPTGSPDICKMNAGGLGPNGKEHGRSAKADKLLHVYGWR